MSDRASASPSAAVTGLLLGDILLPLRLVTGWTYFSAFWRRLILENKLDPDGVGYIGEKFNHFLPNALVIRPVIEFFVSHPDLLWWKLLVFTLVEAVVGAALMAGLCTRLAGLATSALAFGILLGAGWLGTTCLDEWQIGLLGMAAGLAAAFGGGGRYSLDHWLEGRRWMAEGPRWRRALVSTTPPDAGLLARTTLGAGLALLLLTLATNQEFHGGVWGKLHNKSVRPKVEVTDARLAPDGLRFSIFRVEGADVYGSFLVAARLIDEAGSERAAWDAASLARVPAADIANAYVARVKTGPHGLILPLGARAGIRLDDPRLASLPPGRYTLELEDVSGLRWSAPVLVETSS